VIRTEGPNLDTLPNRVACHARQAAPLVAAAFENLLLRCPLAQDHHEHVLRQSRPGAQSFSLVLCDGREFHFRGLEEEGYSAIAVRDRYREGTTIEVLRTPGDVRRFFEGLSVSSLAAAV